MSLVLDAGALIALERGDRTVIAALKRERSAGRIPVTHGGVIGQAWRGGRGRQARLAMFLAGSDVRALDEELGRRAGVLLGRAGRTDVIDAALVLLAEEGDEILTADPQELRALAVAAGTHVELTPV